MVIMALNHDYIPEIAFNRLYKLIDCRGVDDINDTKSGPLSLLWSIILSNILHELQKTENFG